MSIDEAVTQLEKWKSMGLITIPPKQASVILGCHPYSLNVSALNGTLKIPHTFTGNRLRISVEGLLRFVKGESYFGKHESLPLGYKWRK